MTSKLIEVMKALYRSEINCSVSCFWDGGWDVALGDEHNGFHEWRAFDNEDLDSAADWLIEEAKKHYPNSAFVAYGIDDVIRATAAAA